MLDLYELRQLVAFAELGTLSKAADQFHVSTPLNMTGHPDRINIELTDPEVDVTFYLMRQTMVL